MIKGLSISDHIKYLQKLKHDLKYDRKTPLRKKDKIKQDLMNYEKNMEDMEVCIGQLL